MQCSAAHRMSADELAAPPTAAIRISRRDSPARREIDELADQSVPPRSMLGPRRAAAPEDARIILQRGADGRVQQRHAVERAGRPLQRLRELRFDGQAT